MSKNIKIAPSILSADFAALGADIAKLAEWGADYVHFDVMDGSYVPPITFGADMLKAVKPYTDLPFDVHLMVERPEDKAMMFADAGAEIITFHPETTRHPHRLLGDLKKRGVKAGIVINPGTSISYVDYLLPDCDIVLLMSVNPGYGGQKFIPGTLRKGMEVAALREAMGLKFELEIDGGVSPKNAADVVAAGFDVLVSGSGVFGAADKKEAISIMKGLK